MNLILIFLLGVIDIASGSLEIEKRNGVMVYFLKDGVTLTFDSTVVTSDEGIYFIDEKWGKLYGHVRLKTPDYTINADSLIYFEESGRTIFRINVSGMDSSALFEAENVVVQGDTAFASGGVYIFLVNDSITFRGDSAVYYLNLSEGKIFKNSEASLVNGDTVRLNADSLRFKKNTLTAWGEVSINSSRFRGGAFELVFSRIDEATAAIGMFGGGVFDAGNTHVEGDTLSFNLVDGEVRDAKFSGSPEIKAKEKNGYIRVRASEISVELEGDSLRYFEARGKVEGEFVENE